MQYPDLESSIDVSYPLVSHTYKVYVRINLAKVYTSQLFSRGCTDLITVIDGKRGPATNFINVKYIDSLKHIQERFTLEMGLDQDCIRKGVINKEYQIPEDIYEPTF